MLEARTRPTDTTPTTPIPDTFEAFCTEFLGVRLTFGQRVLVRVSFDDIDPQDLETEEERALAEELFGPIDAVQSHCRAVHYWLKGARMGGTYLWALFLVYQGLTLPLTFREFSPDEDSREDGEAEFEGLAPGEIAFGAIVAPELALARQALRYCTGAVQSSRRLAAMIVGKPTRDALSLVRDDGKRITIECRAASRGGRATRGFSYFGGLLDESSFFEDAESGVVNDSEIYRSISARLLPGAKLGVISTAWAERGLLWDSVQENHGHPKTGLAVIAPTLLVRNTRRNRQTYAEEHARDALNAAREFDCVPFDVGTSAFFDPITIDAAVADIPELTLSDGRCPAALAIDTAFRRDATGGVITRRESDIYTVAEVSKITPERGKPLKPSEVITYLVGRGKEHHCQTLLADQHYIETVREHAEALELIEAPAGNAGKMQVFLAAKTALAEGQVRISRHHKDLVKQLKDVVSKPLPGGGLQISSPRSKIGGHGDTASAFVLTIWFLADGGSWSDIDEEGLGGIATSDWRDDEDDDWEDD